MKFCFWSGGRVASSRTKALSGLFCFCVLILAGCSHTQASNPPTITDIKIDPQPPRTGPATINFRLADGTKPVAGSHIVLEADMSHPGMAPVFTDAREIASGQYQGQLQFDMAGDWVVLLHITLPTGKKFDQQLDVKGVQGK